MTFQSDFMFNWLLLLLNQSFRLKDRPTQGLKDIDNLRCQPGQKQQQFLVDVAASLAGLPRQIERLSEMQRNHVLLRQQDQLAREKLINRLDSTDKKLDRLLKRQARLQEDEPSLTSNFSSTLPFCTEKSIEECLASVSKTTNLLFTNSTRFTLDVGHFRVQLFHLLTFCSPNLFFAHSRTVTSSPWWTTYEPWLRCGPTPPCTDSSQAWWRRYSRHSLSRLMPGRRQQTGNNSLTVRTSIPSWWAGYRRQTASSRPTSTGTKLAHSQRGQRSSFRTISLKR